MQRLDNYIQKVIKNRKKVIIFLIPLFLIFGPVGFNAYSYINVEVGIEDLGTDQAVLTFTSLTDDVIFVVNGDDNLISQEIYDWTSQFAFELQNNEIVDKYTVGAIPVEHVFDNTQQLLSKYYVSIRDASAFINITTYIMIEGTIQFINYWKNADDSNTTQELASEFQPILIEEIEKLQLGEISIFDTLSNLWLDKLAMFLNGLTKVNTEYQDVVENWTLEPENWMLDIPSTYEEDYQDLLNKLSTSVNWDVADIIAITSEILFGEINSESTAFLREIFDFSADAGKPIRMARDALLPFLRTEFLPYGFPETIRDFYLSAYTNSDGDTLPTSMILRFRLRTDLSENDLKIVFEELEQILYEKRETSPDTLDIGLLSFLNYQRERSESISSEMHRVDLIAIIIGTIVLYLILRDIFQSGLIIGIAWTSTQVVRGIFIPLIPVIGQVNSTSFSIATTLLLGASMNYTVFFKFRYFEERSGGKDHQDAVTITSQTALHSVLISGIAIVISMIPYNTSSLEILDQLALSIVVMMSIQIILLFHLLPVVYSSLEFISDRLKNNNFEKLPTLSFNLNLRRVKHVLVFSIILGIISLLVIYSINSTFVANDIIGDSGETGYTIGLLEDRYPEDYLSKYLISLDLNTEIQTNGEFVLIVVDMINELTSKLAQLAEISSIISLSWPLGQPFNYTDDTIGQVEYQSALIIADQLVQNNNQTFIVMQSTISSNSGDLAVQAVKVQKLVSNFISETPLVQNAAVTGLPSEIAELTQRTGGELPGQIIMALILITVFLTLVLKSIFNPLRLEFTIILASLYSIALASTIYSIFNDIGLNIIVISSSFLILLGLGTDFDIYLFRRIKEEETTKNIDFIQAIDHGVKSSAPAIMSSGLVMAFSFLALFYSDISIVRQFGLVTFITILIDILVVRTIIVPAILIYFHRSELDT